MSEFKKSALVILFSVFGLLIGLFAVFVAMLPVYMSVALKSGAPPMYLAPFVAVMTLMAPTIRLVAFGGAATSALLGLSALTISYRRSLGKTLPVCAVLIALLAFGAGIYGRHDLSQFSSFPTSGIDPRAVFGTRAFENPPQEWTPLMKAAEAGDTETLRALLKEGADPTPPAYGWSVGGLAVKEGHMETLKALLEEAPSIQADKRYLGVLVKVAAINDRNEIATFLLEQGANIDVRTEEGWTPLMHAAYNGHVDVMQTLIDRGADLHARNNYDWTILLVAANNGQTEAVRMLLTQDVDVNARNYYGATALHRAAQGGHLEIAEMLLDAGADFTIKDRDGHTPMRCAGHQGQSEVIRLLHARGAKE
jgi:hypothetical protein